MENISDKVYKTVQRLIAESEWGRSVTNNELFEFLFNEVYEFLDGCNRANKENILEEASDVLMILLYIVIKNVDGQSENQIDELFNRIYNKLYSRYSSFFDGDISGAEEQQWHYAKYIEKEILQYLYCPSPQCTYFAKTGRENMTTDGEQAYCQICGYTDKCSNQNVLLYSTKYRRKLFDTLGTSFLGYLKGSSYYADDYFNSHRYDYCKVIRYMAGSAAGRIALKDFFTSKYNVTEDSFDEFLMYPLRNCLKNIFNQKQLPQDIAGVNDMMIMWINTGYSAAKTQFCGTDTPTYQRIWIDYIQQLLQSMSIPIVLEPILADSKIPSTFHIKKDTTFYKSYILYAELENGKKCAMVLQYFSVKDQESGASLQADVSVCKSIVQVGQIIMSAVIQFGLQHTSKLQCRLKNCKNALIRNELTTFLNDIFPTLAVIEY